MKKEEALKVLVKMRAWRRWGKGEQNEKDRPEMPEQKEVDEAFDVCIEMLSQLSQPFNLDEAAEEEADRLFADMKIDGDMIYLPTAKVLMIALARFGVEWMAKQGETREVDLAEIELNKFTEKVKTFQGRYKYPEILSIKGAMAFMARMFYQYPSVARQWYERLPKSIMD